MKETNSKVTSLLYLKRRLFQSEINFLGIICNGLIHHTPKKTVLKQLNKEVNYAARVLKLNPTEIHYLHLHAANEYNHISKKTFAKLRSIDLKFGRKEDYEEALKQRTSVLYSTVRKHYVANRTLIKQRNVVASHVEQRLKHDKLYGPDGILEEARSRANTQLDDAKRSGDDTYSPFFICSAHPKPAKDHRDFEGKCYFDSEYSKFIPDESLRARIESYIKNRHLVSVQKISGAPIYLTLRKNCKHYFTNIPIEEVLHSSPKSIIKKRKLWNEDEIPATPEIRAYRAYYERVKTDKALSELIQCDELKEDMVHDEAMLAKYTRIINSKHGK